MTYKVTISSTMEGVNGATTIVETSLPAEILLQILYPLTEYCVDIEINDWEEVSPISLEDTINWVLSIVL
jgi:hypothetical protein